MAKIATRGGDLEGAALPLLPVQGGVLRRHAGGEGGRARSSARSRTRTLPPLEQLAGSLDAYLRLDRGERGQLRQDDPLRGRGARGAGAARPRARRDRAAHRRRAARRRARRHRCCARRCAAGSGSWTARAWTGSSTRDLDREALHGLLLGTLMGAVLAAGESDRYGELTSSRSTTKTSASSGPISRRRAVGAVARGRTGSTSTRRPPTFMPSKPWSQPGMTCPAPSGNENGSPAVPGVVELRAVLEQRADVLDADGLAGLRPPRRRPP